MKKYILLVCTVIAFTDAFSQEPRRVTYNKNDYNFVGHWIMDYQVSKWDRSTKLVGDSAQIISQSVGLIWMNGLKIRIVADSIKIHKLNLE